MGAGVTAVARIFDGDVASALAVGDEGLLGREKVVMTTEGSVGGRARVIGLGVRAGLTARNGGDGGGDGSGDGASGCGAGIATVRGTRGLSVGSGEGTPGLTNAVASSLCPPIPPSNGDKAVGFVAVLKGASTVTVSSEPRMSF
jgi:hypothetical protein